jgi:P-type Cu+ transporter
MRWKYEVLDDAQTASQFILFKSEEKTRVKFYLPQMHCNSCIWLLEHLYKLDDAIFSSQVNFAEKFITIDFDNQKLKISDLAKLLSKIGYDPHLQYNRDAQVGKIPESRSWKLKIGIAGFGFATIMMLSFPEYFSGGDIKEHSLKMLFQYMALIISLPVYAYSARDFYVTAWKNILNKFLHIDIPIALAIVITFLRSVYEIFWGNGSGYLDSGTGIIFFMLLGRYFQNSVHEALRFDRDYTSYFPLGITILKESKEKVIPVSSLEPGMDILLKNNEILPADSLLIKGAAIIDYSFTNGENTEQEIGIGEIIYAGGKHLGPAITLKCLKNLAS